MRLVLGALLVFFPAVAQAQADAPGSAAQPSVLVTTEMPRQGSLPRTLTAYGTVQASPDGGSETLSVLRGGQVLRVMALAGQAVRKGQPLLAVSADPAALAAYHQAVAALTLARGERARTGQMLAQHLATRDQLAQADKAVTDAQTNLDALNRAGGGDVEQTLSAPFDGIVANVLVTPGARFAPQAALVTVARSDRLVAAVGIEPAQRGLVAAGQPARIEALDEAGAEQGRVISVGAMLDPQSRLVPVLVDPPQDAVQSDPKPGGPMRARQSAAPENAAPGLLSGGPVRVTIQLGELHGWLVPRNAVLTDAKGAYLFQVDSGKATRVDVRILGKSGGITLIAGQVDPRRSLVTSGNYQLQDGGAVRENMAAPRVGRPSRER